MSDTENKTPEVMDAKAKYEQLRKEKAQKKAKNKASDGSGKKSEKISEIHTEKINKTNKDIRKDENDIVSNDNGDAKKQSKARTVFSYLRIVIIAVAAAIVLTTIVIMNARVPTGSMKDTINENDRLIGLRLAYVFGEPQRGDIVIFKYPDDENTKYVKRVIGLPGETVSFENGDVYINGELLDEPYLKEPHSTNAIKQSEYTVPENSYFMLGDNRNNSKDARWWNNTWVTKDKILAKVVFRYFNGETGSIGFSGF